MILAQPTLMTVLTLSLMKIFLTHGINQECIQDEHQVTFCRVISRAVSLFAQLNFCPHQDWREASQDALHTAKARQLRFDKIFTR